MRKKKLFAAMVLALAFSVSACGSVPAETGKDAGEAVTAEGSGAAATDGKETAEKDAADLQKQAAAVLEPVESAEIGTAGSSLKAVESVNDFMKLYKESGLSEEDFKTGAAAYYKGLSADAQEEFTEQATMLNNSYPSYFTTDGASLVEDSGVGELGFTKEEADQAFGLLMEAIGAK